MRRKILVLAAACAALAWVANANELTQDHYDPGSPVPDSAPHTERNLSPTELATTSTDELSAHTEGQFGALLGIASRQQLVPLDIRASESTEKLRRCGTENVSSDHRYLNRDQIANLSNGSCPIGPGTC